MSVTAIPMINRTGGGLERLKLRQKRKAMEDLKALSSHIVFSASFAGLAGAALILTVALGPGPAMALPQYAAQTKLPCSQCHVNKAGGGTLKPFGEKFRNNGHKLK
jgi:hypothetical protein